MPVQMPVQMASQGLQSSRESGPVIGMSAGRAVRRSRMSDSGILCYRGRFDMSLVLTADVYVSMQSSKPSERHGERSRSHERK